MTVQKVEDLPVLHPTFIYRSSPMTSSVTMFQYVLTRSLNVLPYVKILHVEGALSPHLKYYPAVPDVQARTHTLFVGETPRRRFPLFLHPLSRH